MSSTDREKEIKVTSLASESQRQPPRTDKLINNRGKTLFLLCIFLKSINSICYQAIAAYQCTLMLLMELTDRTRSPALNSCSKETIDLAFAHKSSSNKKTSINNNDAKAVRARILSFLQHGKNIDISTTWRSDSEMTVQIIGKERQTRYSACYLPHFCAIIYDQSKLQSYKDII